MHNTFRTTLLSLLVLGSMIPVVVAADTEVTQPNMTTVSRGEFLKWVTQALELDTTKNCTLSHKRVTPAMKGVVCAAETKHALDIWKKDTTLLLQRPITRLEAAKVLTALTGNRETADISRLRDVRSSVDKQAVMNAIALKWFKPLRLNSFGGQSNLTGMEAYTIIRELSGIDISNPTTLDPTQTDGTGLPRNALLNAVWNIIQRDYLRTNKLDTNDVSYQSIEGLVQSLKDPYTTFFRPSQATDFESQIKGQLNGAIGAHVELKDGVPTVLAPLSGSPAEKAGLKPGDKLLTANGKTLTGITLDAAVTAIRGEKGTTVTLGIMRDGVSLTIPVVRDDINIPDYEVKWQGSIAIVKLSQFGDSADRTLRTAFAEINSKRPRGIILDMRNNPGGLLHAAIEVASNFVPKSSPIVQVKSKTDLITSRTDEEPTVDASTPLVLLVNKGSASASEIVAGAMKDLKRATIVGTGTFGKGTVQEFINFESGEALKLTVAEFLSPYGNKIDGAGVQPDIVIDTLPTTTTDAQLARALQIFQ